MTATATRRRVSTRALIVGGLLVAFVIAGFVSHYASRDPDGLEYVATQKGFADTATAHAVEDQRLSGAAAGIAGTVLVLVLAGGVALLVRRRDDDPDPA